MGNFSVYLNYQEVVDFCTKYNCKNSDIAPVLKACITERTHSRFYRELSNTIGEVKEVDEQGIIDEYLKNTAPAIILMRRSDLTNRPVFTPKSS